MNDFIRKVISSFSLTLVFELLVSIISAFAVGIQKLGFAVLLPHQGVKILLEGIVHVLQPANVAWMLIVAIAWQIAALLLKHLPGAVKRMAERVRPVRRRVRVLPTHINFDRTALKKRLSQRRPGDLDTGTFPA